MCLSNICINEYIEIIVTTLYFTNLSCIHYVKNLVFNLNF